MANELRPELKALLDTDFQDWRPALEYLGNMESRPCACGNTDCPIPMPCMCGQTDCTSGFGEHKSPKDGDPTEIEQLREDNARLRAEHKSLMEDYTHVQLDRDRWQEDVERLRAELATAQGFIETLTGHKAG